MDVGVYNFEEISNDEILERLRNKESFKINKIPFGAYTEATAKIESLVESLGYKCRVYTIGRVGGILPAIGSGVGAVVGIGTALTIAAHNVATWSPDYEIGRNLYGRDIELKYKK
ncbi:hypothetical protein F6476_04545 [Pseudomonas umsongensis]|uniref:hypothetical protein n=1 Tax=Pseudomonas umsongensis TaxID=198618 RepID=UPI00124528C5|nr:hypothetical protein [Pseudomonas umsongensis]QFG28512.1 hypothetical protein F6476_04545 [Pseudomonas umsongensis]